MSERNFEHLPAYRKETEQRVREVKERARKDAELYLRQAGNDGFTGPGRTRGTRLVPKVLASEGGCDVFEDRLWQAALDRFGPAAQELGRQWGVEEADQIERLYEEYGKEFVRRCALGDPPVEA